MAFEAIQTTTSTYICTVYAARHPLKLRNREKCVQRRAW